MNKKYDILFGLHTYTQRISNQSSHGLISPISPTSPGMDWVTITILKMDWNCNGSIWFFQTNPFQSKFVNFHLKLQLFSNFSWIQISCLFWIFSSFLKTFLCNNKEQPPWKFLHCIYLKLRIKMYFGLDWWTDQSIKKIQNGLVDW